MTDGARRIAILQRELASNPASRQFYQLGELLRRDGRGEEAAEALRAGLAHHPRYVAAWVSLGRACLDAGQAADAVQGLEQALALDSQNPVAWRLLGEAHLALGDRRAALEAMRRSLELVPGDDVLQAAVDALNSDLGAEAATAPPEPLADALELPPAPSAAAPEVEMELPAQEPVVPSPIAPALASAPPAAEMPAAGAPPETVEDLFGEPPTPIAPPEGTVRAFEPPPTPVAGAPGEPGLPLIVEASEAAPQRLAGDLFGEAAAPPPPEAAAAPAPPPEPVAAAPAEPAPPSAPTEDADLFLAPEAEEAPVLLKRVLQASAAKATDVVAQPPASLTLARLYVQQQALPEAVGVLERLLEREPHNIEARDLLALVRDMMEPLPAEAPALAPRERKIAALQRWLASLTLGRERVTR